MIGTGRSQKWHCHFEGLSISRALSARSLIISGQDTLPPQQLTPVSVNEQVMTGDNDAELDNICSEEGRDGMVDGKNDDIIGMMKIVMLLT